MLLQVTWPRKELGPGVRRVSQCRFHVTCTTEILVTARSCSASKHQPGTPLPASLALCRPTCLTRLRPATIKLTTQTCRPIGPSTPKVDSND